MAPHLMKVTIRTMTPQDIAAAVRLKDLAGGNQTARDWQRLISLSPEGCFAAEHDGAVIGTSSTIVFGNKLAWIGMVIVAREFRGCGIGNALLQRAVHHLDERSVPCIKLDATPQGKPLYERLGFASEFEIERWTLRYKVDQFNAAERGPESKQTHAIAVAQIDDAILRFDREVFGADRSDLLWGLNQGAPEFTLVARHHAGLQGYGFGRRGALADQLGPWVAQSEEAAACILDNFLRRSTRKSVFIDCVKENRWALPLVKGRGFEIQRPLTRMFRGINTAVGKPDMLCAILGPEFG
jgi:ribosomal protein S18 acetylase RimI-like enzyme